jgi:hypothetical protein
MKRFLVFPYWLFWIVVGVNAAEFFQFGLDTGRLTQADWDFVDTAGRLAVVSWMLVSLVGKVIKYEKLKRELGDS